MVDVKYCSDPAEVKLMEGAAEGLQLLAKAGYLIVLITNQSGIGRGYFTKLQLEQVHHRLRQMLLARGADLHAVYYCPHRPEDSCACRKPQPGLLIRAASELNIDLSCSYTIGNGDRDVEAGRRAGTKTVLIHRHSGSEDYCTKADIQADSVEGAAQMILKNRTE